VCFVTFNYDLLFDYSLRNLGMRLESMEDHVSDGQFTYVKIHGSVDWGRPIKTKLNAPMTDDTPLIAEIVSRANSLELGAYERSGALPIAKIGDTVLFPAIAIPLEPVTKLHPA
jgi:hypothetical protein